MNLKAIVFDWDGTLFDSMVYKRSNFIQLFESFGIGAEGLQDFHRKFSGIARKDLFQLCLRTFNLPELSADDYDRLSKTYTQMNLDASRLAKVFPDALNALTVLRQRGFQLYVSSSSAHDELLTVSASTPLRPLLSEVLGSKSDFQKGPAHINYFCEKYSYSKNQLLFVGDDEQDMVLAKAAQVRGVRIHRGNGAIPQSISSLMDLLDDNYLQ